METLPDTWHARDYPALVAIARKLETTPGLRARQIQVPAGLTQEQFLIACEALEEGGYIHGKPISRATSLRIDFVIGGLRERGRRAVGMWPNDDPARALLDALKAASEQTSDPEERTRLRKALKIFGSVSESVLADVTAAMIRQLAGL